MSAAQPTTIPPELHLDPQPATAIDEAVERATRVLELAGTAIATGSMLLLAVRTCLRLELRWDTFSYHLPFAAHHGRLGVPYELPPRLQAYYHGFPPLPELLQGILWRLTGTVNATGVVNYLAFSLFLFFHSLFEVNHPTHYDYRERWIIDQGNAGIAFRSGGFWVVAVVTGAAFAALLGFLSSRRRGWIMVATILGLWCAVSVLPQSHDLRYFMFLPLTMGTLVAMLYPRVRPLFPAMSLVVVAVILAEFVYVTRVNRVYYRVERVGWNEAAEVWQVKPMWQQLAVGQTYCAVNYAPAALLLTGPTMHEFHILDRDDVADCPAGVKVLKRP